MFASNGAADRAFHRTLSARPWAARADHRDPPGRRDDAGVVVRQWAVDRHRRGLDQTEAIRSTVFVQTRLRENVRQAKVCDPARRSRVNVLPGQCKNTLG